MAAAACAIRAAGCRYRAAAAGVGNLGDATAVWLVEPDLQSSQVRGAPDSLPSISTPHSRQISPPDRNRLILTARSVIAASPSRQVNREPSGNRPEPDAVCRNSERGAANMQFCSKNGVANGGCGTVRFCRRGLRQSLRNCRSAVKTHGSHRRHRSRVLR